MSDVQSLLSLPTNTLIPLAAGYLAYRVAYTGKDGAHSSIDVIFLSLVYAVLARSVLLAGETLNVPFYGMAIAAMILPVVAAAVWRKWVEGWVFKLLRSAGVSASDRHLTAWQTVIAKGGLTVTQLIVHRKDGVSEMCDDLHQFRNETTGAFVLGADGSVALFVTHQFGKDDRDWQDALPLHQGKWGPLMTYIPSSEISKIEIRI